MTLKSSTTSKAVLFALLGILLMMGYHTYNRITAPDVNEKIINLRDDVVKNSASIVVHSASLIEASALTLSKTYSDKATLAEVKLPPYNRFLPRDSVIARTTLIDISDTYNNAIEAYIAYEGCDKSVKVRDSDTLAELKKLKPRLLNMCNSATLG
tara:strand:- start:282 stop:746 length:465 start_codon:yes stop_codon:yes gene_type:complete